MLKLVLFIIYTFSFQVMGTTFVPISIKKQIIESDDIIHGEVRSIQSERTDSGIVTYAELKIDHWLGDYNPETEFVKLYFPGGTIGDDVYEVHGSPQFEIGESVVVFTKKVNGEVWVNNLGLGKFSLKTLGAKKVLVNQVFPGNPQVGQITWDKFVSLSEWMKKRKFQERFKDKYELNKEKQARTRVFERDKGRSIASIKQAKSEKESFSVNWLVFLLAILLVVFKIVRKKIT